jgi:hypothetical protein
MRLTLHQERHHGLEVWTIRRDGRLVFRCFSEAAARTRWVKFVKELGL